MINNGQTRRSAIKTIAGALASPYAAALVGTRTGGAVQDSFVLIARDFFVRNYDEGSDTANLQAALDEAAAFAKANPGTLPRVIVNRRSVPYVITNVAVTDDLILDFDGSTVEWRPSAAAGGSGTAASIYVSGARAAAGHGIDATVEGQSTITLTTGGNAAKYAVGDYIEIADNKAIPMYSDPDKTAYTGRTEMNQIMEIAGGVLRLAKSVERAYDTSPTIIKLTDSPRVKICNIGDSYEIDPGAANPAGGGSFSSPNVITLNWALRPLVEDIAVRGFTNFAVFARRCIDPVVRRVDARDAFYPTSGGNGYLFRATQCLGARITDCRAEACRHLADDTQSVNTYSALNRALRMTNSAYVTHGWGSKNYTSEDDYYGGGEIGWAHGNIAFAGDDGMTIINPVARSTHGGIRCWAGSKRMTIINPDIQADHVGIAILQGAEDVSILGGRVDARHVLEHNGWSHGCGIAVRKAFNYNNEPYATSPKNVTIQGVEVLGPSTTSRGTVVYVDAEGDIDVSRNKIVGGGAVLPAALLQVSPVTQADSVHVVENTTEGVATRSLAIASAPSGIFEVTHNRLLATNTRLASNIKTSARLRFLFNENGGNGKFYWNGDDLATVIEGGALVFGNSPAVE